VPAAVPLWSGRPGGRPRRCRARAFRPGRLGCLLSPCSPPGWRPAQSPGRPGRTVRGSCWYPAPRGWPPSTAVAAPRCSAWPPLARWRSPIAGGWRCAGSLARPRRWRSGWAPVRSSAPLPRSPASRFPFRPGGVPPPPPGVSPPPFPSAKAGFFNR
jgi:hypothetical protein